MNLQQKLKKIMESPVLWIESFCTIVNKEGKKVPFKLNPQQKYLLKNLDKYDTVLKSRQLGISAVSCAYSLYLAMTQSDSHCLLISYSLDSANAVFDKLKQLYDDLPDLIKLKDIANNRKELKFENGSKITVATMGTKDVARGSTLRFVHLSEMAFMNQEVLDKQMLALEQALAPNGHIIVESTANGFNKFSELWDKAENGTNLYKPFFFSWIDDKIMFANEYKDFSARYKALNGKYLEEDELEPQEKIYLEMGATLEQLMWRRLKIANSSEEQFRQEFPATPLEAFITSGNNIFNSEKVQTEYNRARLSDKIKSIPTIPKLLKTYLNNYLSVWKDPEHGIKYSIGVDASEGLGEDYSVISVYDFNGYQCAEFRSNKIQPHEIAKIVNEIGTWYNRGLLVVEKASGGHIILDRLKYTYKYTNLYKYKDYDARGKMIKKIGFNTTAKSKPIMINDFVEWWENNDIFINSATLLAEMKTYQFSHGSMNAQNGKHDDTIIATALAIQGIKSNLYYR